MLACIVVCESMVIVAWWWGYRFGEREAALPFVGCDESLVDTGPLSCLIILAIDRYR